MANRERVIVGLVVVLGSLILTGCAAQAPHELTNAVKTSDVEKVKLMLADKPELVNANTDEGGFVLRDAFLFGGDRRNELVEFLIENGAEVNRRDSKGRTILHFTFRHRDIAELLIANGADVNAKDDSGRTALYNALNYHRYVKEGGYGGFERECGEDLADCAKLLIDKGADVNIHTDRDSVLTGAVKCGYTEIVKLLITQGSDVNMKIKSLFGNTPLQIALRLRHKDIAELLRKHGAKE